MSVGFPISTFVVLSPLYSIVFVGSHSPTSHFTNRLFGTE